MIEQCDTLEELEMDREEFSQEERERFELCKKIVQVQKMGLDFNAFLDCYIKAKERKTPEPDPEEKKLGA